MLKKIFDYLFYSCRHTYEIHHSGNIVNNKDITIGAFYHLKCSKCGEIKFKRSLQMKNMNKILGLTKSQAQGIIIISLLQTATIVITIYFLSH